LIPVIGDAKKREDAQMGRAAGERKWILGRRSRSFSSGVFSTAAEIDPAAERGAFNRGFFFPARSKDAERFSAVKSRRGLGAKTSALRNRHTHTHTHTHTQTHDKKKEYMQRINMRGCIHGRHRKASWQPGGWGDTPRGRKQKKRKRSAVCDSFELLIPFDQWLRWIITSIETCI